LYCFTADECSQGKFNTFKVIEAWTNYFIEWKKYEKGITEDQKDILLATLWKAHTASIKTSLPIALSLIDSFSQFEKKLGLGWAHFVEFIAESRFRCDFVTISKLQPILPQRALVDSDGLLTSQDLTIQNKIGAKTFMVLYDLSVCPNGCFDKVLGAWKKAMNDPAKGADNRRIARANFENIFTNPQTIPSNGWDLLKGVFSSLNWKELGNILGDCVRCL